jgi:hypothetical protein
MEFFNVVVQRGLNPAEKADLVAFTSQL